MCSVALLQSVGLPSTPKKTTRASVHLWFVQLSVFLLFKVRVDCLTPVVYYAK